MAKRPSFGNTWWSQQWLNALAHIDYDNRLPRGRAYANKGAVRGLEIDQGTIKAQVTGSRSSPYRVLIKTPALSKAHISKLLKEITGDPVLIARLLNRELDPALLEKAQALGISLFPTRWQDLTMQCSCPDWAVPCKHLAAVVYLLSREIDSNPFLVFSLRGVDLVRALKTSNVHIGREAAETLPRVTERWRAAPLSDKIPADKGQAADRRAAEETVDYSTIPALAGPLLEILPARPAFHGQGDFREVLRRGVEQARKSARRTLAVEQRDGGSNALLATDRPQVVLDSQYQAQITGAKNLKTLPALLEALVALEPAQLPDFQPEVAALYQLRQTALHLLAQGAVMPQVFAGNKTTVELRWFPAILDKAIHNLMEQVSESLPPGLAGWKKGRSVMRFAKADQAECLCSLFLDCFIHQWSSIRQDKSGSDKCSDLFFATGLVNFNGPGESSMAAGIQAWLSRLHLVHKDYVPVLRLDEGKKTDFTLTVAVEQRNAALKTPAPLQDVLTRPTWAKARFGILQTVSLLAGYFAPLNDYVSSGARAPLRLRADELPPFLFDTLPILRFLGIRILLPKALEHLRRPRLSMRINGKAADSSGFLSAGDLFSFDWKVAVGDQLLTRSQFEKLLKSASTVVRFKGEYVYLDAREIEHLRTQLAKPPALSGNELLRISLAGEFAGAPVTLDQTALKQIKHITDIKDIAAPKNLRAALRPYQQRGYAWLYRNARIGFGSVIADDMGLGKTVQVIATILKLKQERALKEAKVLIVVPTTLLTNWQKELARFAPALSVEIFHGAKRELSSIRPDVLLSTFGVVRAVAKTLNALAWKLVVIDEAQNIKNPAAAQSKAVKAIPADCYIAMSGTPVENRLSEYWSIMDFANRGYLGNLTQFARDYATPIQREHDHAAAARFRKVTAPFLLRRLKSDKTIISDLPDKIEQDQYCALSKDQAALYQSVVEAGLRTIAGEGDTFKRQGLVLQMILALKQICNHPAQYLKQGHGDPLSSGKTERLFELLDEMHTKHEKVLVFTQFREMGKLLSEWLNARYGREPQFLHGGVSRAKRDAMVENFQRDRTERIFILSLKAGGTGLNLTAASNVVHYDLWWNPAVEAQATDRAYRIGQQRNVQVHRLITRATFEERINEMIHNKKELAELTVGTGEQWIGNLSTGELKELFAYGG